MANIFIALFFSQVRTKRLALSISLSCQTRTLLMICNGISAGSMAGIRCMNGLERLHFRRFCFVRMALRKVLRIWFRTIQIHTSVNGLNSQKVPYQNILCIAKYKD